MGAYIGCYLGLLALKAIDSGEVVTPFMQDGTYPTRNFATLGPLLTAAVKPSGSGLHYSQAFRVQEAAVLSL